MQGVAAVGVAGEFVSKKAMEVVAAVGVAGEIASKKDVFPSANDIEQLIEGAAERARPKNFKESDRIRDELAAMGVVLKDTKDGTTWEIAR